MICPNCGNEIEQGIKFCGNCGMPINEGSYKASEPSIVETVIATGAPSMEPMNLESTFIKSEARKIEIPIEYKPLSTWEYLLYSLLFYIPLIGWVFLLIFSFGGTQNKNLKNYARARFYWLAFSVLIGLVLIALYMVGAANAK